MLQPALPAPALGLYEPHVGPDSFSPHTHPSSGREPRVTFASLPLRGRGCGSFPVAFEQGRGLEEGVRAAPAPAPLSCSGADAQPGSELCLLSRGRPKSPAKADGEFGSAVRLGGSRVWS